MRTQTLALFDVAAVAPVECRHCEIALATHRITWVPNLLVDAYAVPERAAAYLAHNGVPYPLSPRSNTVCHYCGWWLACVYWRGTFVCPTGRCVLWAHTWDQPAYDCDHHHRETTVVWLEPLEVAS